MNNQKPIQLGWTWKLQEVSNGQFHGMLTSQQGPVVEITGTDPEEMRDWCIAGATDIDQQLRLKFSKSQCSTHPTDNKISLGGL